MDIFNNFTLFISKLSKYRFIGFIAIVFSIFLFNPLDSFAYTYVPEDIKITFYGFNGSSDSCEGLTQCYNFVPEKIANRVQVQSQKVSFTEGKQYKMYISLKLSVPTDYTIYDYYLSDYLVRNYNINVNKSDFKFLYWDDFGWFNVYQWDLELTVNPTFQGSGVSFDFYKSQDINQQIWILDVLDFHSELLSDSADTNSIIDNDNRNTQDIINNQNKNNEELQNTINNNFNSCRESKNLFNALEISRETGIQVNGDGSRIVMPLIETGNGITSTRKKLKELAPTLKVGDTVFLSFNTTSELNRIIYITVANVTWLTNTTQVITQEMLDNTVYLYGNRFSSGETGFNVVISDLIMSLDKKEPFEPYGEICKNKLDSVDDSINNLDETNKGIWDTIKELPSRFLDMLIGLFIPEDFSFLDNFKDALESKLGFIAEIPISILDFMINLANANWETFDSISFPSIEIFGYNFWESQEISLQPAIDIFEPYKYITDILCVVLCCNTLLKWYQSFTDGGGK